MIRGLGIDLVDIKRIARTYSLFGSRFLKKFLTPSEIGQIPAAPDPWLAGRFAAKEACVKALGTGFRNGIYFHDIEINTSPFGQPFISLHNLAKKRSEFLSVSAMLLSISHERAMACAVVILEG